jgi:hypothetical protein
MTAFKTLLVEGTSGVGKSTLIDALIRRHVATSAPRKIRSLVHLAQSHTYGPLAIPEDRGTLTVQQNQLHLERIVSLLEWLHASVQEHTRPSCFVVIDTLHLTHCVRPGIVTWPDVAAYDRRMAALGCKLLLLQTSDQAIWDRGIEPRKKEQFLLEYAKKFRKNHNEIHEYFVREQRSLADLFSSSAMPKLLLQNDASVESAADRAYRFWMDEAAGAGCARKRSHDKKRLRKGSDEMTGKEFIRTFEADAIPEDGFHHADHVRLAFAYLSEYSPLEALERFCRALRRYAAARGKADRYNDTPLREYTRLCLC